VLSVGDRQAVVDALIRLLVRDRLWITEPTVGRALSVLIGNVARRWRIYEN